MLKIKEGAVWPPKPEEVSFDAGSWEILRTPGSMCSPDWARVTELGGRIGTFLIGNMDEEAACDIANRLHEDLGEEQRESFMLGVRNSINIGLERRTDSEARVRYEDDELALVGANT